jgi:hypothetical protein
MTLDVCFVLNLQNKITTAINLCLFLVMEVENKIVVALAFDFYLILKLGRSLYLHTVWFPSGLETPNHASSSYISDGYLK